MCSLAASQPLTHDATPVVDELKVKLNGYPSDLQTLKAPLPNPSLQVTADHNLKRVDAPVYAPKSGEVLLHIKATGICGSDVHFWKTGCIGSLVFEGDCIIGHEAAGVVIRVGEDVTDLKPGDRVAVEPGVPCGHFFLCKDGRYNLCEDVQFSGGLPLCRNSAAIQGHPAKWLHKYDKCLFRRGRPSRAPERRPPRHKLSPNHLGTPAVICGAGPIGLLALAAARASGAHPLVITDVEPKRLAFAKDFVPTAITYQVDISKSNEQNGKAVRKLFGETEYAQPRVVFECTGIESSVCSAAYMVRRGGVLMVVGVGRSIMNNLPFMHLSLAEIQLRFINRYKDTWPAGIACIEGGLIDAKKLVSHVFPLEQALEGLTLSADPKNGCIKVQIVDETETTYF
ncbi:alcohol dehydrogenase [Fusarium oxysporum f. sp. lycopersici 4287]|uniref:L-arabinitol 4-dehydrogenase n=1 Tax=Fusarium oxysporum f. sp. lycopersici (strain 4287 / CBS 123668 / FGSC 9935 / NRRL 34936) TaxID=426428 RepID=A0A0J9UCL5_FUSO4|nr:alcohol dehydrogenase [Fusarium oxysporum f. sp. lycopersici 4287]KNA96789.1 alcohol dehydrogenase [Fusarium oxysporum f. sp. lycopersici 4287]